MPTTPVARIVSIFLLLVALASAATGLLGLAAWVLPSLFHAVLPHRLVETLEAVQAGRAPLDTAHLVLGLVLTTLSVAYLGLVVAGKARDPRPVSGTSTTLFFQWIGGLLPRSKDRITFRQAIIRPDYEIALVVAIALLSAILRLIPSEVVHHIGRSIHRANAFYAAVVIAYFILYLGERLLPGRHHMASFSLAAPPAGRGRR